MVLDGVGDGDAGDACDGVGGAVMLVLVLVMRNSVLPSHLYRHHLHSTHSHFSSSSKPPTRPLPHLLHSIRPFNLPQSATPPAFVGRAGSGSSSDQTDADWPDNGPASEYGC
eukprot:1697571-Rhodomonas_salina.2